MTDAQTDVVPDDILLGIFVGGQSSRMGQTKGLLTSPLGSPDGRDRTLVQRLVELGQDLGLQTVLVGKHAEYACVERPMIEDAKPGAGPLGGLVALFEHARHLDKHHVIALAVDLPFVSSDLLAKLAFFSTSADLVCAKRGRFFEPLFARYHVRCEPAFVEALQSSRLSLQPILTGLVPDLLALSSDEAEQLRDWDRPEDVAAK